MVQRPPSLNDLRRVLAEAVEQGRPFQVVHFDGHGSLPGRDASPGPAGGRRPVMPDGAAEGVLAFEAPGGGSDLVTASTFAAVMKGAEVPVVVLNACQSGAVGKDLEAAVATRLLREGCAAVVAMAYSVYAVAAAEFMTVFYERLFAGDTVSGAVTAGRRRLAEQPGRPSPIGDQPLEDWLVPVHYMRRDVAFPQARAPRPSAAPSLDAALDQKRDASAGSAAGEDPLAAADGMFVGRDDLLYQLEIAARLQRVVVLAGPGGTGKSELAKDFARWWRDTGGTDDPRLVFWHSFEPGEASFGLDGVITSIGLELLDAGFEGLDPADPLEAVRELLADRRALLVWDNFESVREMPDPVGATPPLDKAGCAALKGFLEWVRDHSSSTVIITSRTPEVWLGQVLRIKVGGLNQAEAARYAGHLLARHPGAQARRQSRSFGELLEWLEGHPLAMRLTLPLLDATEPADLLAGLRGTAPLPAPDDADAGRATSLPASITYSWEHLSGHARRLLPAVSLLQGIANIDLLTTFSTAAGVPGRFADADGQEWEAVLEDAAWVGLLAGLGGGLYRIHPALPGYLAAGWHAADPDGYAAERQASERALRAACAAFSRWLTEQLDTGNAGMAYALIALHRRTLSAMLGHALAHQAWDDADTIVRALDPYWKGRGLDQEAGAWADRILDATAAHGLTAAGPAQALWLYTTVHQATRQNEAGHPGLAAQGYRQALARLQDQPSTEWTRGTIAVLYHHLGTTARDRGQLDEADDWYRRSLAIDKELGNRRSMAETYSRMGVTAQDRGRLDEADDWCRRAIQIHEELGLREDLAGDYHRLGAIAQARGRLDEADDWYCRCLAIGEEFGNRPGMAITYHQLGMTAQARERLNEADDWYRRSLAINVELGNGPDLAMNYHQLGMTAQERGRLDEADDWYRRAIRIREELGLRAFLASDYHQLGMTAQERGRLDEADDWYPPLPRH